MPNHIGENKNLQFFLIGHILHNGNNIVKDLMISFFEFTNIIGQFKQR